MIDLEKILELDLKQSIDQARAPVNRTLTAASLPRHIMN